MVRPEQATVAERFVLRFHLPYEVGSLALSMITGVPGLFLVGFLNTLDTGKAFQAVLSPYSLRPAWTGVVDLTFNTAIIFYMLLMIRFMRQRILAAEPSLSALAVDGETAVHRIFGRISNTRGQLVFALILFFLVQLFPQSYASTSTLGPSTAAATVASLGIVALFYIIVGTFVWVYISSLWSLHKFGREPLRLRSYMENRLLGAAPFGSLSLSLALAYYSVVGPTAIESLILSPDIVGYATLLPLVILGSVMFFLPLYSIHRRMQEAKQKTEEIIHAQITELLATTGTQPSRGPAETSREVDRLIRLETFRYSEKRLGETPTWPFDRKSIETITAILLSILTAIVARLVFAALGL